MISKAKATDNLLLPLLSFWNPSCRISTFLLVWYRIWLQFLLALTCTPSISALRYLSKQSDRKLSEQTREFDPTSSLSSHKRTIHSLNPLGLKGNEINLPAQHIDERDHASHRHSDQIKKHFMSHNRVCEHL